MNTQFINALYLIDSRISLADRERLIAGLPVDSAWALIEETEDGVGQIRDIVSSYSGLGALHLIGHGSPGSLLLGAGSIDLASINQMAAVWAQIGTSLSQNGDILLYGCNTAQGQAGLDTLEQLARITSADIAASVDQTGAAGNWVLETSTGSIEAATLSVPGFQSTLDTVGISSLRTTSRKPTITGSVILDNGRTLEVEIGGKVYKAGDGKLSVDSTAHTWTLNLGSETSDLAVGSYDVKACVIDAGPAAPVSVSLTANGSNAVNLISGTSGNDTIAGRADTRSDIAVFSGNRSDYTITAGTNSITVKDNRTGQSITNEGTDTLTNLNQLKFADGQEFVLAASQRVALSGTNTVTLIGGSVVNGIDVTASKLYNGTKSAETFVVAKNVSAMILAGAGDNVDLIGRITDYTYSAKGSQLQISDGAYTTTINVGGNVTLRTASGSYAVSCSYANGSAVITLGDQAVNGSFSATSTTRTANTLSSNAESIVSDATSSELELVNGSSITTVSSLAILGATTTSNSYLNTGDVLSIRVGFNQPVNVTGTPQLALNIGGVLVKANYVSGSGTADLVFTYAITQGLGDDNGISIGANSLSLNGGSILSLDGNTARLWHAALSDNASYLVDANNPFIFLSNPADNATGVGPSADIVLGFSEPIALASRGSIRIYKASDNSLVEHIDLSTDVTGKLLVSGSVLVINPSNDLAGSASYYVQIESGALIDLAGNAYAGINDASTLNFTTAAAGAGGSGSVINIAPDVLLTPTLNTTTASGSLTSAYQLGNGNIVFTASDVSPYGFVDSATSSVDTLVFNSATNVTTLASRALLTALNQSTGSAFAFSGASADGRYIAMSTRTTGTIGIGNAQLFTDARSDGATITDIVLYDTQTGTVSLTTHSYSKTETRGYSASYVGITADSGYVVFTSPYAENFGNFTGSGSGIMAYSIASGELRLLTHAYSSNLVVASGGDAASNIKLSNDGQYVFYTANNATKFGVGTSTTPFSDGATTTADLFSVRLSDGYVSLLTHSATSETVSAEVAITAYQQSADGKTLFFTVQDASKFGFADSYTTNTDLIAFNIASGTYQLVSHANGAVTATAATDSAFVASIGNYAYFTTTDSTKLGATLDGSTTKADLWRYDFNTGMQQLISHEVSNGNNAPNATVDGTKAPVVSANQRYVAYEATAQSIAGLTLGGGSNYFIFITDTVSGGTTKLVNHSLSSQTNTAKWAGDDTGAQARGFTPDGSTLVYDSGKLYYAGFTYTDSMDRGIVAYDVATGNLRLLSHSATANSTPGTDGLPVYVGQGGAATYSAMTGDGKWVLYTAANASKFGNTGVSFTDAGTENADLFATNVQTGEIRLLSGLSGASTGGSATYVGVSADGNTAYFTETNVAGLKSVAGTFIDNAVSGIDLVSVKLNLLDLADGSDTIGQNANDINGYDNVTTARNLKLTAQLNPLSSVALYDNGIAVAGLSPIITDAHGLAVWNLTNVTPGSHVYTVVDQSSGQQILLDGSQAASKLKVMVYATLDPAVISLATDTGVNGSDWVSANGVVNVTLGAGVTSWQYSLDAGRNWVAGSGNVFTVPNGNYAAGYVQVKSLGAGDSSSVSSVAHSISIDNNAPNITGATLQNAPTDQNGTLHLGDVATAVVNFSEVVYVTGTPQITLDVGGQQVQANYISGSGSASIRFGYPISAGQQDTDGIAIIANTLSLNGGTLTDKSGNVPSSLSVAAVASNAMAMVESVAPVLSGSLPANNAIAVDLNGNIVLTFSEPVQAGTGNVVITNGVDTNLIDIRSGQVSFNANTVTINPDTDLVAGSQYHVELTAGVVRDLVGNNHAGTNSSATLSFTTATTDMLKPLLVGTQGLAGAANVNVTSDIVLTFTEAVQAGTGNIVISNGSDTQTISITDRTQVKIQGNTVTINPSADLLLGGNYHSVGTTSQLISSNPYTVQMAPGVIKDLAGNDYDGLADSALSFQTETVHLKQVMDGGSSTNRIRTIFVGDGYTATEVAAFSTNVAAALDYLFNSSNKSQPLGRYQSFFNVYEIDVASLQSGIDNIWTTPQKFFDTAMGGAFSAGLDRLAGIDGGLGQYFIDKAFGITGAPTDIRFASLNTTDYGGSGGSWAAYQLDNVEMALHEVGHSYAGLADEYGYGGPTTYPGTYPTNEIGNRNVTTDPTGSKWRYWYGQYESGIGPIATYEAGYYSAKGVYRASMSSKMDALGQPFDYISREDWILRFYQSVKPLDTYSIQDTQMTSAAALPIDPTVIDLVWTVDGVVQNNHSTFFDFTSLPAGAHTITLQAQDNTDWVRPEYKSLIAQTITWTINLDGPITLSDSVHNFVGGNLGEWVEGASGDDTLLGNAGNDRLDGGEGNDMLNGGLGDDMLIAGPGTNVVDGGTGVDTVSYAAFNVAVTADLTEKSQQRTSVHSIDTLIGIENLFGGSGNDHLLGDNSVNNLQGNEGDNVIDAAGGNDYITAGTGNDTIDGGLGNDLILAGDGNNVVHAGDGNDLVRTGDGIDSIYGESGADTIYSGAGNDTIFAGDGNDTIFAGDGNDTIDAGLGDNLVCAGSGINIITCGSGRNTLSYADAQVDVKVSLALTSAQVTGYSVDTIQGFINITGGSGNDTLIGNAANNELLGGDGDDMFAGGGGNDIFVGGAGSDTVSFTGATSAVTVSLALFPQHLVWSASATPVTGSFTQNTGYGNQAFYQIENLIGSTYNDTLTGDSGDNLLNGGGGNNTLTGGAGADTFSFDQSANGNDTITDFDVSLDAIQISSRKYAGLFNAANSCLDAALFCVGSSAQNTNNRIVYNQTTGVLSYDADGNGTGSAVSFATLSTKPTLTAANIRVSDISKTLNGTTADDVLYGAGGADTINSGAGSDRLFGYGGSDLLQPGSGNDHVDGGDGADTVSYADFSTPVHVDLGILTAQSITAQKTDTLVRIENLLGGSASDTLIGDTQDNVIDGGRGNDVIDGGDGVDALKITWSQDQLPALTSSLTLDRGVGYWHLLSGTTKLVDVVRNNAQANSYDVTVWYADGSYDVKHASNVESIVMPQLAALKSSLGALPIMGASEDFSLRVNSGVYGLTWSQMPDMSNKTLSFETVVYSSSYVLKAIDDSGNTTVLLEITRNPLSGSQMTNYTLIQHLLDGSVTNISLVDVTDIKLPQFGSFSIGISATGVNKVLGSSDAQRFVVQSRESAAIDGTGGADQLIETWVSNGLPALGSQTAQSNSIFSGSNYLGSSSTGTVIATSAKVANIDLNAAVFVIDGGFDIHNQQGTVTQVDRTVAGQVSFWLQAHDSNGSNSYYKAAKVILTDVVGGIKLQVTNGKHLNAVTLPVNFDWNTSGNSASVANSDISGGYGLKSFTLLALRSVFAGIVEDADGVSVSSNGTTLLQLHQNSAGMNSYTLKTKSTAPNVTAIAGYYGDGTAVANGLSEGWEKAFDGNATTKFYERIAGVNAGIKLRLDNAGTINSMTLTTANDSTGRDPTSYSLYGSNDDLNWADSAWTAIVTNQSIVMPSARNTASSFSISNNQQFKYYKLVFPSTNVAGTNPNSGVQLSEISLSTLASENSQTLSNIETLSTDSNLNGIELGLENSGVTSIKGSIFNDDIFLSTSYTSAVNGGAGVDKVTLSWAEGNMPMLPSGMTVAITKDTDANQTTTDWHLDVGGVRLIDVTQTQPGGGSYDVTMWKSNGSVTRTITDVEFLSLPQQLSALKPGLSLFNTDLNILDLVTSSDTSGVSAGDGTTNDNITAAKNLTVSAIVTANAVTKLYDDVGAAHTLIGTKTSDANGFLSWDLTSVAAGNHHYTLWNSSDTQIMGMDGTQATSALNVRVL